MKISLAFSILCMSFLFISFFTFSQGIRGRIFSNDGESLPFASVFVRNLGDGVPANDEGYYEMKLPEGIYDVYFQILGYKSRIETLVVKEGAWTDFDVRLEPQIYTLEQVEVRAGAEDPALTIMRKAISKSKYHRLQLQSYEMTVYLKGTGQLTDAPFFSQEDPRKRWPEPE